MTIMMLSLLSKIKEKTMSAKKYMGLDKYPGRSAREKRIILKIKPEKVFHMKYE